MPQLTNLSHVELLTTDVEASVEFFSELLGLEETARQDDSVYLRAWGEWTHHSLVLTRSASSGIGHIAYRVRQPADLAHYTTSLRDAGVEVQEVPEGSEPGQGPAVRFHLPSGHEIELLHAFARRGGAHPSQVLNQPSRRRGKGIEVQRIDHVNIMARDVRAVRLFLEQHLGFATREIMQRSPDVEGGAWLSAGPLSHDFAIGTETAEATGRLHHIAYAVESILDYWRFGEMAHEQDIRFEAGPGKHGGTQGSFAYVREPGGSNRVELFTGGYLVLDPDPGPTIFQADDPYRGVVVGQPLSPEFYATGTPSLEELATEPMLQPSRSSQAGRDGG